MATGKAIVKKKPAGPKPVSFIWEGVNRRGESLKGELTGLSIPFVKAELRAQGITPKKVKKKAKPFFTKSSKKIRGADIAIFSRQMATMLTSGIPLLTAFDIVGRSVENPRMMTLIMDVKGDVESGLTFAESLAKHPAYFNDLYCNLVEAGEQSGSLETMLDNIATYKEKTESLKGKIKKALFYPTAVIVVAFIVTVALLIFVIPQFESLFQGFGAELPALTQMVISMSQFFQNYWWMVFGSIFGGVAFFIKAHKNSKTFAAGVDRFMLRIPVIGIILEKAAIARFARTLAITFAAGVPLVDALKSVAGATGNVVFTAATMKVREDVSTGQQLQAAMRATNIFPNMVIQMVAIGEESGSLETMLVKVADFYEEEVDNAVDGLSSLIEPLIMAFLGVIVGGLVISMYLPIFKLGSVV